VLDQSVESLRGVGPGIARRLQRLGIESVGDLLCLIPQRYEDRTTVRPLGSLRLGDRVRVAGQIALADVVFRRRRMLLCRLVDGTGTLTLRFFHFGRAQQESLAVGATIECFGEVRAGLGGMEMVHPEYRTVADAEPSDTLTPIYPTTEGLHQARLRAIIDAALKLLDDESIEDYLAETIRDDWPPLAEALRYLHRPPPDANLPAFEQGRHPAQRRLAFEELVAQRLSLRRAASVGTARVAQSISTSSEQLKRFYGTLPFVLTAGQQAAVEELFADMAQPVPMHRLLQGDVGSGKTVVAALAMFAAASAGFQAALMAPTEILAEQHRQNLSRWFEPLGFASAILTGSLGAADRRNALAAIAGGQASIVIGTHALFQEGVEFATLGLVVVDEQHRFGVEQRLRLNEKGQRNGIHPHQLIMTATPIPRTLAMTAYADLDYSVIEGVPAGRKPIQTVVMPQSKRPALVERIARHCEHGGQAYWVCPLIEESEALETSAAIELEQSLTEALPEVRVGLVHGRMKGSQKDAVMRDFKQGSIGLLIATTVIEVGVDVPNASMMVIENAERMGLAQLHQLRGRVGRGQVQSACVLLYRPPLSEVARERLDMLRRTTDGFAIAQKDLELRGPGEVLGIRQTGVAVLRVADLLRDADLLPSVVVAADRIEQEFPSRVAPLIRRWIKAGTEYAKV
jgi:ATP-dependent DNA helicase RecG